MSLPMRDHVLVRGAWVLTSADAGVVRDGAVLIDNGAIVAVGAASELRAQHPDVTVVGDGTGIVMPGLINTHTHFSEALIPGIGSDLTLFEWGTRVVTPAGTVLTREMAREGARLASLQSTTAADVTARVNAALNGIPITLNGPVSIAPSVCAGREGEAVTVQIAANHPINIPLYGSPTVTLTGEAVFRCEGG